uniref:Intercellular adhesion molecule N-terminal domain-containing protein n=1 Tax=Calidris pygmaea TaxID=425635 RepID=A0A8C3PNX3_9CHAR
MTPPQPTFTPTLLPTSSCASQLIPHPLGRPILGPPTHSFEVKVEGTSSEVGYGGTVLLNCSSSCTNETAPRGLETSLSKEWVAQGPGWFSIRLYNITEPLSDIFCFFSCSGERKVPGQPDPAEELGRGHSACHL